jgi:hypothetical protein
MGAVCAAIPVHLLFQVLIPISWRNLIQFIVMNFDSIFNFRFYANFYEDNP